MAAYLEACLEESAGDAAFIAKDLGASPALRAWIKRPMIGETGERRHSGPERNL
jgi:hypothetical protein